LQDVPAPCDDSTAADVVFDGLGRDGSGRPLKKLVWSQDAADVVLSAAIDTANSQGSTRIVIPGSKISQVSTGPHTITLTATSYLDKVNTGSITFNKQASGFAPVVSVLGGQSQNFQVAQGISISTTLLAASVCAQKTVSTVMHSRFGIGCMMLELSIGFCMRGG
jgi:hypothetical protein